jgi:hypothetical protein
MSRSFGSDGIRRYCDAAVALTIVFATVIARVAAVIVGSSPQFLSRDNRFCAYLSKPTFRLQRS